MFEKMTRKEFCQTLLVMGVATVGGAIVAACGGDGDDSTQTTSRPAPAKKKPVASNDPCSDTSGLTTAELTMRKDTLKYVATSPDPAKLCDNCKFWEPVEGKTCGGCTLIKGPINPKGYCSSWFTAEES